MKTKKYVLTVESCDTYVIENLELSGEKYSDIFRQLESNAEATHITDAKLTEYERVMCFTDCWTIHLTTIVLEKFICKNGYPFTR